MHRQQTGPRRATSTRHPRTSAGSGPARTSANDNHALLHSRQRPAMASSVGGDRLLQAWASALGNQNLGQLLQRRRAGAAGEPLATAVGTAPAQLQREARRGGLAVSLTFSETPLQNYELSSENMQGLDEELPADVGQFNHEVVPTWGTAETESGVDVTSVRLPVQHNYIMPLWTRLSEQPRVVRQAWQRFYGDVLTHEREHLSVCRRYYTELRETLQALPPEERSESRVQQEINDSIERQNEAHRLHTGFTTPDTIVFSDYIPASERESVKSPEAATE